ncbi:MAG: two-component sensor histidine kinase [Deltaproteobacteria bacterium]|nr:two-component sensor histidine kinase [Deltaproteobacteria bacterium]
MTEEKTSNGLYYRSLIRNIVILVIIVSFTPMFLVSGIILYQFHHSYSEKIHDHLGELVLNHKQNIDSFLKEKLKHIRFLAKSYSFEELSNESFLQEKLSNLQEGFSPFFVDLGVINERGVQIAYAGPYKLGGAVYSEAEWFKAAFQKPYYISDVFLGLRELPHFIIAVQENWRGRPWILRATIDFVAFNTLVQSVRIGETGFAFIINTQGECQTRPCLDMDDSKQVLADLLADKKNIIRDINIVEKTDTSGGKNLYVASFLKDGDWLLVYQQAASDALADLNRTLRLTIILLAIGGLAILTMAFVLSRRVVMRIAKADQEKQMMNKQVVETGRLAAIGELAAGIAHEINNPVAIMVEEAGWIEDLMEEGTEQEGNMEEFKRALKQIQNQGRRCKEITHKLLSFARKTDSRVQSVQVNELIEEVVNLSSQRARYANVEIHTNLQPDLPETQMSMTEMQQVLMNMINNAMDAMEKKGGRLDISTELGKDQIIISIRDNGPGIPAANLAQIFVPFFTTKPVGKGTGLGLAICYGIIKKMDGEIEVDSTVGKGTTFRIVLPLIKNLETK